MLDCERDPAAAGREIVKPAKVAIDNDRAQAICLCFAGMGLDTKEEDTKLDIEASIRALERLATRRSPLDQSEGSRRRPSVECGLMPRLGHYSAAVDRPAAGRQQP